MPIVTDPLFYALAVPAVLALGLSKGGLAGVGQMALPLLALVMPPLEAAAIMLPIMIAQDLFAVWVYRKDWDKRILAIMIPGAAIGIMAAWALAAHISDAMVRIFIAVITLVFVAYNFVGPKRVAKEADKDFGKIRKPTVTGGAFWGALSGFSSTICQAGGPPYQIYVLRLKLAKMVFVSTNIYFFAAMNWIKVVPYAGLGLFTTRNLVTSLALLPLALAFNQLGFWVVRRLPEKMFFRILMVLMVLVSLELLRSGITDLLRGA
ncbi:MAG: sulfite exporter TauE/SafE family protein [Pseudolabrys sp.]|nr:sulfite exporter TauE/SafE family protein [Pseudolabrys sp.]